MEERLMEATRVVHDATRLAKEWHEFQQYVMGLQRLYFYVPGSHDLSNPAQEELWKAEFGRRDYDFCYKGVLMLNSGGSAGKDEGHIFTEQLAFVKKSLARKRGARWILVFLHKPNDVLLELRRWLRSPCRERGRPCSTMISPKEGLHR